MPIRAELKPLYPADWAEISRRIRFDRADGRCERCGRWHGQVVPGWRPDRVTRIVLTTAHLDHDPTNNAEANLAALCQRCHLAHDKPHHVRQRRLRWRLGWAIADLFSG